MRERIIDTTKNIGAVAIGRQGENKAFRLGIDVSALIGEYGDGVATLTHARAGDDAAYPVNTIRDGSLVWWVVEEADTRDAGTGRLQLIWVVNDVIVKTVIFQTLVAPSLNASEDPPEPWESWVNRIAEYAAECVEATGHYPKIENGRWYVWDVASEDWTDTGVDAQGPQGNGIDYAELNADYTLTLHYTNGDSDTVGPIRGAKGAKGDTGNGIASAVLNADYTLTLTWTNGGSYTTPSIRGVQGETGETGNGIDTIELYSTLDLVDTYVVTFTDGSHWYFDVTNGEKGDTGATGNGIASIAKTGTSGNVDTYTITYTNGNTTTFMVTNGSVTSVDGQTGDVVLDYAKPDGYYEELTVGEAEDLITDLGLTSSDPYSIRKAGGSLPIGGGRADLKQIVGLSLPWNQLEPLDASKYRIYNSSYMGLSLTNGVYTATWLSGASGAKSARVSGIVPGHVYYASLDYYNHSETAASFNLGPDTNSGFGSMDRQAMMIISGGGTGFVHTENVITASLTSTAFGIRLANGANDNDYVEVKNIQVVDLTILLGKNIADYVSGLSEASARCAWLRRYLPNLGRVYYPYAAIGSAMRHVNVSAIKRTGFNLYKHGTTNGTAQVLGGVVHQITGAFTTLTYSDGVTTITPDADGLFTPDYNDVLTVTGGNELTTCVHIYDETTSGDWEPYEEHTYALDSSVTLYGIPKRDGDNLVADGDIMKPNGNGTRRYFAVNLGTLNWVRDTAGNYPYFSAKTTKDSNPGAVYTAGEVTGHCSKYVAVANMTGGNFGLANYNGMFCFNPNSGSANRTVIIQDSSYSTAEAFATAMNGVYLVYEIVTPTALSADLYTEIQICEPGGIEQFVPVDTTEPQVPVGNVTLYQQSLKAKLEAAPELPQSDGDYHLHMSGGVATYEADEAELPSDPSEDGTYVLKLTKSGTTVTKFWEAVT